MSKLLLPALATLALAPAAQAQEEPLTPDGPATVRGNWLGPSTAEGRHPTSIVAWRVTVGPDGQAGRVRLRVLSGTDHSTSRYTGPYEWLPAEPGVHEYRLPPPTVLYDTRDGGLALDQEAGGHAVLERRPLPPGSDQEGLSLDVFRPPLAPDAREVPPSERHPDVALRVEAVLEGDDDLDGFGDVTQDVGDLRLLRARALRRPDGRFLLRARVRNTGTSVRHLPAIVPPPGATELECPTGDDARWTIRLICRTQSLAPGESRALSLIARLPRRPTHLRVDSEGPDLRPADNRRRIRRR